MTFCKSLYPIKTDATEPCGAQRLMMQMAQMVAAH
jgi:hypothetical protein